MALPFQDARILADGARARALELGTALSIAVVDYGGFVILIERMDGARPMTPDIAWNVHHPFRGFRDPGSPFKERGAPGLCFYTQVKTAAVRFAS